MTITNQILNHLKKLSSRLSYDVVECRSARIVGINILVEAQYFFFEHFKAEV